MGVERPDVSVKIGGREAGANFRERLKALHLTDESQFIADSLRLEFTDTGPAPLAVPAFGEKIECGLGFRGDVISLGTYYVDECYLASDGVLEVEAKAFDTMSDIKTVASRHFQAPNLRTLVQKVGAVYNLDVVAAPALERIVFDPLEDIRQHNESALHFLTRLAVEFNAALKFRGGRFYFREKALGIDDQGKPFPKLTITRTMVEKYEFRIAHRFVYSRVEARVVNTAQGTVETVSVGTGEPVYRFPHIFESEIRASAAVNAKYMEFSRSGTTAKIKIEGNRLDLFPERIVELNGFRDKIDGQWLIDSVRTSIDQRGFWREFAAERLFDDYRDRAAQLSPPLNIPPRI